MFLQKGYQKPQTVEYLLLTARFSHHHPPIDLVPPFSYIVDEDGPNESSHTEKLDLFYSNWVEIPETMLLSS